MADQRYRAVAGGQRAVRRSGRVLIYLLAAIGCNDSVDVAKQRAVEVRDSSGVRVVSNLQEDRLLTLEEVLRVGVMEGDPALQFDQIRSVALDESGGFWVVDSNEAVRHYGKDGHYLGSVGGQGGGPGEALGYFEVWAGEESVLVAGFQGVLQRFGSNGTLLESGSSSQMSEDGLQALRPIGAVTDARWVMTREVLSYRGEASFRNRVAVLVGRMSAESWDTVTYIDSELHRSFRVGPENAIGRGSYFEGNPSLAVDGAGRIHVSDTAAYRIASYGLDGSLERFLTRSVEPRPFDPIWLEEMEASFRDRFGSSEAAVERGMEGALPATPLEFLPFIEQIFVSRGGTLWVRRLDRHPRPGLRAVAHSTGISRFFWEPEWLGPVVLDIFTPEGVYRGSVQATEQFEPMAVTDERVYGRLYDELGVEQVVAFRIRDSEAWD